MRVKVEMVPTVNFVLRWITGQTESHRYDEDLESIELVTADGYEPMLPLSLILHIDYQKAPRVVQRFGDVRRLISQTLDPILTAYFRDVAQGSHMLDLLTKREEIQQKATVELGRRFQGYDINCVAVLIGRPEAKIDKARPDYNPIEQLFDQLRLRRLAEEQKATYSKQEEAAVRLKEFNHANAAGRETEGTDGDANRHRGRRKPRRGATRRVAEASRSAMSRGRKGESRSKELLGKGEAARIAQIGLSEAAVQLQKIRAYGDPRLFALNLVSEHFANSTQPLVPERMMMMGDGRNGGRRGRRAGRRPARLQHAGPIGGAAAERALGSEHRGEQGGCGGVGEIHAANGREEGRPAGVGVQVSGLNRPRPEWR